MGQGETFPSCPLRPSKNKKSAPQRVVGRRPTAFSRLGSERSGRDPIPHPMDEVRGFFYSFCRALVRCLCFRFSTYVVHAVSENHFKPASWAVTIKDSNPLCCPRSANNREGKNGGYSPPRPPTRNNVPGPDQFGHSVIGHDGTWAVTNSGHSRQESFFARPTYQIPERLRMVDRGRPCEETSNNLNTAR